MTNAIDLLRASEYGVKDFKTHLSERIKTKKPMILVGKESKKVIVDYDDFVELIELIEDLQDKELMQLIHEGRTAIERGEPGIDAAESIRQIRAERKKR